jgi:hypothetical protein
MSNTNTHKRFTGADLIGIEDHRDATAKFLARLNKRQASLQYELASLAAVLCSKLHDQLDAIEERLENEER